MDMDFDMDMGLGHGQDQEQVEADPLDGHAYLMLPLASDRHERCAKLCTMEIGGHVGIYWELLKTVDETAWAREIVGFDTPFARLFHTVIEDLYREITVKFLSSFIYGPHPNDYVEDLDHVVHEITFRLAGQEFGMSLRVFVGHSGLYTHAELDTYIYTQGVRALDRQTLVSFWMATTRVPFGKSSLKATAIKDPLYRYLHRIIGSSIVPGFTAGTRSIWVTFSFCTSCCGPSRAHSLRA
ncbi:hypothetical protein Hanom_Chr16g01448121 [Helianthus anomalus]